MIRPQNMSSAGGAGLRAVREAYLAPEADAVMRLVAEARTDAATGARIEARARALVETVRAERTRRGGLDAFLHEYDLSSREGIVLMCLAEALLRIPDPETANRLIRDKLAEADFSRHLGEGGSIFVNASTWALMLTGRLVRLSERETEDVGGFLQRLVARSGEPVVRQALLAAMRILGRQFVMGRTIGEALARAREAEGRGYRHSYDMLGEAARTRADAERYHRAYLGAIEAIGREAGGRGPLEGPGISVKLSALHPRYEEAQRERVLAELWPRLREIAAAAREVDIGLTIDAEEAERLDLSLALVERLARDPGLAGWEGLGLAVQAYQKRARPLIDWLEGLARASGRRLMVRLVKGAYWDTEIKRAQERGLAGYPVFTRKVYTDVSYLACARRLLAAGAAFYPQFATHNAHTVAWVLEMAAGRRDLEFQRLHGMGEPLYDQVVGPEGVACRVYAPVGSHEDLLPYLVRRLLENGANTSFVNRIVDERLPVEAIVADPVARAADLAGAPHPRIPLPADLYAPQRRNSAGIELNDPLALARLAEGMGAFGEHRWRAAPLVAGRAREGRARPVHEPADRRRVAGEVVEADEALVDEALAVAAAAQPAWDATPATRRAEILERVAELYERHRDELMAIAVREGGKTIPDALAEVREAVDFCRYYAAQTRAAFAEPMRLPGPTGEDNRMSLHGRGVFACISPWNFPLAIFTGQVAAALAAGNAVVAKPAEQTPLMAARAVALMHEAGVPGEVLHLLPGAGEVVGARLVADPRTAGVAFTGSTETARHIHRALAAREGPIVPLIAETGGQNCMVVDSSALPEQVVVDVLTSAFRSAGQRCSALRVLFVQEEVAERLLRMIAGAMDELAIGDPRWLATDVGPVIDEQARATLAAHVERMEREARILHRLPLPGETANGTFFPPTLVELDHIGRLEREVFGPVLHVIRYRASALDRVIEAINGTGYGLTLGVHTRIDATARYIHARVRVGNTYVNRNMIGAVVGVQPFGGEGLSGTGPKAGGPHYLLRFATERTLSIDTTAAGGNASLVSLQDEEAEGGSKP
ncbi:bifunctional proline dehydrogenase/L-glutamate gamma-semialdehyde dehydrogenase PutA [Inmirania thermothiophila]|uniref:Bifunctional protein PutA n=1 Tax=Inmirania thermothiophila TaxID=1750597 RepID=A0A3N1Y206_9GAMM|nr:bifunctional proline dehydrogenase/L-glutamate gamma-semialdehyde dehydrogenase PutA [Inmirania thermothiophila]ROR32850.1 L-proline dehydrogenase /delta-1-pyrroline-5-carboxylate dehydrogenase [Inmirania thermothiophila]